MYQQTYIHKYYIKSYTERISHLFKLFWNINVDIDIITTTEHPYSIVWAWLNTGDNLKFDDTKEL